MHIIQKISIVSLFLNLAFAIPLTLRQRGLAHPDLQAAVKSWGIYFLILMGGMVAAVERGYPQREIADSAYRFQQEVESGRRPIVGVTTHTEADAAPVPILYIDDATERAQLARLDALRRSRDAARHAASLAAMSQAARDGTNLMPSILDAVRAYATVGEMCDVLREAWGEYVEEG